MTGEEDLSPTLSASPSSSSSSSASSAASQGSGPSNSDLLPRASECSLRRNAGGGGAGAGGSSSGGGGASGALSEGVNLNANDLNASVGSDKKKATQLPVPSIYRTRHSVASAPDLEAIIVTEYSVPLTNAHRAPALQPFNACRPLAVLLRFRVAQVASGFCTFLLGCSALLDRDTRHVLFAACIVGLLCVFCTAMHIVDCRQKGPQGLQYIFPGVHVTLTVILTTLGVVACLGTCVVHAFTTDSRNVFKLALSQSIALTPWILVEVATIALRVIWARRLIS